LTDAESSECSSEFVNSNGDPENLMLTEYKIEKFSLPLVFSLCC